MEKAPDEKVSEPSLAGKSYCRTFPTNGGINAPAREVTHCIRFLDDKKVTNDGSTAFGNPPEQGTYKLKGHTIILTLESMFGTTYKAKYVLAKDGKSIQSAENAGQVLTLK